MKKYLTYIMTAFAAAAFFIFSVPVTVLADNEAEIMEMAAQGEIISDVNVRKGPGTDHEKIGTVREGDIVTVTGQSHDGWYRIEYQGAEGFIYGQYMTVISTVSEEPEQTAAIEQQEETAGSGEEGAHFDFGVLKAAAAVVIIVLIIVMIFLTLRSMRQAEEDMEDDEDDEDYDDEDDDDEDDEDDDSDDYDDGGDDDADEEERALGKGKDRKTQTGKKKPQQEQPVKVETVKVDPKTIVIREEDYQLHIDPKYFEDEPIAQPDCVTGYLQKKQQEEEEQKKNRESSGDLQKAMDKLQELQEEIEKLKKNQ